LSKLALPRSASASTRVRQSRQGLRKQATGSAAYRPLALLPLSDQVRPCAPPMDHRKRTSTTSSLSLRNSPLSRSRADRPVVSHRAGRLAKMLGPRKPRKHPGVEHPLDPEPANETSGASAALLSVETGEPHWPARLLLNRSLRRCAADGSALPRAGPASVV